MFRHFLGFVALSVSLMTCAAPRHAAHSFDDAETWAQRFEDPNRDQWQKPDSVIAALGLKPSARIADLGSATGYFTVRLAKAFPEGVVYGVDVESSMVSYLSKRVVHEELKNVHVVLGAYDDPKIPEPVDLILIVDTYHHIQERPAYFKRLSSSLTPTGRIVVIDFKPGADMGPPDSEKLLPDVVMSEMQSAGFRLLEAFTNLPKQYFLIFGRTA